MKIDLTTIFVRKRDLEFYMAELSLLGQDAFRNQWNHFEFNPEYHYTQLLNGRDTLALTDRLEAADIPYQANTMTVDTELLEKALQSVNETREAKRP